MCAATVADPPASECVPPCFHSCDDCGTPPVCKPGQHGPRGCNGYGGTDDSYRCLEKRTTCGAGQYFTAVDDEVNAPHQKVHGVWRLRLARDDTCTWCPLGKFKAGSNNATSCTSKATTCGPGEYFTAGQDGHTQNDDTTCTACPGKGVDVGEVEAPGEAAEVELYPGPSGSYSSTESNATACTPKGRPCGAGEYNDVASGNPSEKTKDDTLCLACGVANADCAAGEYYVPANCHGADDGCTPCSHRNANCSAGTYYVPGNCQGTDAGCTKCSLSNADCGAGEFYVPGKCNGPDNGCTPCSHRNANCGAGEYYEPGNCQGADTGCTKCSLSNADCRTGEFYVPEKCNGPDSGCTTCGISNANAEADTLLFASQGSSNTYRNTWTGWYSSSSSYTGAKTSDYNTLGLTGLRFEDAGGRYVNYKLGAQYAGKTLLQIVLGCMGSSRSNTGSSSWDNGLCSNVAAVVTSQGVPAQRLRIGVGDGGADSSDWALFMPLSGNGGGDFAGGTWAFGGEDSANNGHSGTVKIFGIKRKLPGCLRFFHPVVVVGCSVGSTPLCFVQRQSKR